MMTMAARHTRPSGHSRPLRPIDRRRSSLLVLSAMVALSLVGSWGLGLLVQASSTSRLSTPAQSAVRPPVQADGNPKGPASKIDPSVPPSDPDSMQRSPETSGTERESHALQGPALDVPLEVIAMLDLRKHDLDKREDAIRVSEERLILLKTEIEHLLTKYERMTEASDKKRKAAGTDRTAKEEQKAIERKNVHQAQLIKIFESMPPEEAAARIEKMPDRKAVEVLRLLKGKTAGAILAQVKVERAAKLTEQLLANP